MVDQISLCPFISFLFFLLFQKISSLQAKGFFYNGWPQQIFIAKIHNFDMVTKSVHLRKSILFNIFKSNRMENLMDALASVMEAVPDNPMSPEWIGIQSRGMKQWINLQLAQKFGVSTNLNFFFPRQMVDHILAGFTPLKDQHDYLNEDFLFWSIMKLIRKNQSQNFLSYVENYIKGDETGKKPYQLCLKIAKVFDDYQVYRPQMLMDWQNNPSCESLKDPVAQWQAELWTRAVSKDPENHLAFKARLFLEKACSKNVNTDNFPSRMSLFGISALPEVFVQIFEKMSEFMDINLFLLTPSNQFFFDIKSARQIGRLAVKQETTMDPEQLYYEITNPLLSSLGTAGKKFHSCLEAFNYNEAFFDLFQDPVDESNTMLAFLQSDILNLVSRKSGQDDSPVIVDASDTSVSIHACHSPMREAQVLKDLLLNEFEKQPDLSPHDIIIMMPDIEAYAPFIQSVFSLETALPFSISDRRKRSESESLDAFLKILALKNSRLEQTLVLDLLLSGSIAKKFNISMEEIPKIEKMVEDAGIFWGRHGDHRQSFGLPPFEENTWQFGLQRLFMGMAMPENYESLVQNILPCHCFEGVDLEILGKFAAFTHALFTCLDTLAGQKTIEKWCEALTKTAFSLMDRNFNNGEDLAFLSQTIDTIKTDAQEAEFSNPVSFDMINSLVEHKLDQSVSQGNFLVGNITFCNIMPMRSIPFKVVVLMGMDENSFPRQAFTPGFDLIKKYPQPHDKIQRDEDRYLFLETLLSARSKFIITYTGMSIQDNSKIPSASVVSELADTMDQSFVFQDNGGYHFFHPLHPFNEEYFNQTGPFFSFSEDNCHIARALSSTGSDKDRSENLCFVQGPAEKLSQDPASIHTLDDIIRFFKNPVQGFLTQGLNIKIPGMEELKSDREAFTISGLAQYSLGSFILEKKSADLGKADLYPVLKAMGTLPLGQKGRLEYETIKAIATPLIDAARIIASKKQLPPIALNVNLEGLEVSGNFSDIKEDGLYSLTYGKLNGARLLSGWIRHLFFNICAPPGYPGKTILMGRDPKGKKPLITCSFPPLKSKALTCLTSLIQMYAKKGEQPLYFFCETSWQFVQALAKEKADPDSWALDKELIFKAMNRSKTSWYGGYYQTGEKENPYVSLCVENNDPFESVDALISSGFVQNAIDIYKPLLENLEIVS
jgi:exodeoxyribonuclease V gamma subunit